MGAHSHHHEAISVEEQFEFTAAAKKNLLIGGIIGLILILIGSYLLANPSADAHGAAAHGAEAHATVAAHGADAHAAAAHGADAHIAAGHDDHYHWTKRLWANLWLCCVYFTGISVIGMFFVSYNYLAQAGWSAVFKRIPEAMPSFLPVTGVLMLITFFVAGDQLFHWRHEGITDPASHHYDAIIAGKSAFLNVPFYVIRMLVYFIGWYGLWRVIRNISLQEDELGGTDHFFKGMKFGTIFLVLFAVTSSTAAWDFVMSIDTHWFSTMFGWYTLASWHVSGLAFMTLTIVFLKDAGYLKAVNSSHLHDLGKFCFAFTIFFTYVWFAQFLLIYYANLPEETIYFRERFSFNGGIFKAPFFMNIIFSFLLPFLVLMTRDSKRTPIILKVACSIILFGHYIDFYTNIMPGTLGEHAGFGPVELGFVIVFACAFIWFVLNQLTKANLIPRNHPMLEESLHHDIA